MILEAHRLQRTFKVARREEGLLAAVKSLFRREFIHKHAVRDVSFAIDKPSIVGLLGPNGAGKSTTIKMLTGILQPSSGTVEVLGFDPLTQRKEYVKQIGVLFGQKTQLWWDIPAIDSFGLSQRLYDIPMDEFVRRRDDLIERLGVHEEVKRPVRNLSLGERMKCEFIMAFLHRPKVVFLDEPTIGLDMFAKEAIREFITYAHKELKTTIILTTHDMDDIEHLAQRVIVINEGTIVFDDSLPELRKRAGGARSIRIVTQKKLSSLRMKGVSDVQRIGEFEATLKLDIEKTPLQEFISKVGSSNVIQDLEVSRPDVEEVIKELY